MSRCPSPEELERFLEEELGAEQQDVSRHVDGCGRCQQALEGLTGQRPVSISHAMPPAALAEDESAAFLRRLKQSGPVSLSGPAAGAAPVGEAPRIANYEILGELSRGGMGVVYRARQVGLNRLVALKMILAGPHAGPRELARFRDEAEAVARLRHPNIIQIYDIGESEGHPFIAMEYVAEGSLAQKLRGAPQPLRPAAKLVEVLARAIHYAHEHGIIHRDLKPANVLLQSELTQRRQGAKESLGGLAPLRELCPKISDFGLAKRLDGPSGRTQSGELLGTPSYMAPEQAAGRADQIGPATDVYALGAILYELLTGRPPFQGASGLDTVVRVLHEEPARPRSLRPGLSRDLETICLKCLSKEPERRYASAEALAEDLHRFLDGRPILARPVGPVEYAWQWARRRPHAAALLAGMVMVAGVGFAGVTWQWREATRARDKVLAEQRQKEEQRERADTALYYSRIAQSQLHWRLNDFTAARQSLAQCLPAPGAEDRRGWEWHYLHGLLSGDLLTLSHGRAGAGGGVAYRADGRRIVAVVGGAAAGAPAHDAELCTWDAATGAALLTQPLAGAFHRLALRPDGEQLALAAADGTLLVLDAATAAERWRCQGHTDSVPAVAFSPDGRLLASAGWDGSLRLWDSADGKPLRVIHGHGGRVQCLAFHPGGRRLASGSWDATVRIWDIEAQKEPLILRGHKGAVYGVAFSPDGALLASAGSNGNLKIWDIASGKTVQSLTGNAGAVFSVVFSPDGRYLAYGGGDATVRVWDIETGMERGRLRGHTAAVEGVAFSPDGQRLVSSSPAEGAAKVWDLTRHPVYADFARTGVDVEALAFAEGGQRLVSATVGGKLQTWDARTGVLQSQHALPFCSGVVSPAVLVAFSSGGHFVAARCEGDPALVKQWDTAGGEETMVFRGHAWPVRCVRYSKDGRYLITAACDVADPGRPHEIKVWDPLTGEELATRAGRGQVYTAVFSPDSRWLALGLQDGAVGLMTWQEQRPLVLRRAGHRGEVSALAFSPDGRWLASAGAEDRAVQLWDMAAGPGPRAARTLVAPGLLGELAFSPDGQRLAGISRDVVKLWDVATGQEVLTLRGAPQRHWDPPFNPRLAFSPDGRRLAGTNWDESISLWDAEILTDPEARARYQAQRRQAADERARFWHLQEAEYCLEHHRLSAAAFHLQRLQNVPLPGPLHARREVLTQRLAQAAEADKGPP
jgi:WD40 repeat protein/serine/threonine protein kinase